MNIKVVVIENLRQIQIEMLHRSFQGETAGSLLRGQGRVLSLLRENAGLSRSELGRRLNMSRAGLAELLGKMEKSGLITRSRSSKDKRRVDIDLTEEGKKAAEAAQLSRSTIPDMLDCLDIEELNQFNEYLERIIKSCSDEQPGPISDKESAIIAEGVVDSLCKECPGPESCRHDYKKYGHDRPNPAYCKYADQFPF